MFNFKNYLINYMKFILFTILILLIYDSAVYIIYHPIHTRGTQGVFLVELPLVTILATIFYLSKIKNKFLKYIIPSIPILSLYIMFDIFYSFVLRAPRMSDFENFINIYDFAPVTFIFIIVFILFILYVMYMYFKIASKYYSKDGYKKLIVLKLVTLVSLVMFLQSNIFKTYQNKVFEYTYWSHQETIKNNGKISSFIYYSNLEKINMEKLKGEKNDIDIANTLYKNRVKSKQNIYFVVLESFINPNYLKNIKYNRNPMSDELSKYLYKNNFSNIISPVYGGNTAQAEFEILTGIKAFAKVSTTEFNVLSGNRIDGFLYQLKKNGYKTMATIGTYSGYFNSKSAYKSLGFENVVFLEETDNFKKSEGDEVIFDGDLFRYNINYLNFYLKYGKKPIFNYVLGFYGHMPYKRNKKLRPDVIKPLNTDNKDIKNIANIFYYRTKALAEYIDNILKMDPDSIIMISSDHIPPILNKKIKYKYERHHNIALFINKGKPMDISNKHQYQIPWKVWDIISQKSIDRNYKYTTLEQLYFKGLNEGI